MGEQTRNMLIGVFIMAACTLLVSVVFFLRPHVGDGGETLFVRFSNINRIAVGTRVTYAGRPVGEVVEITEIEKPREQPTDAIGRYYLYQLKLRVDSSVVVFTTDKIELQTSGLLGEKSVAIIPRKPPEGITPRPVDTRPIYADSVDPFDNALHQFGKVSHTMDKTLHDVRSWIEQHGPTLGSAVASFGSTMDEAKALFNDVSQNRIVATVNESAVHLRDLLRDAKSGVQELKEKEFFTHLAAMTKNVESVASKIQQGEGTLGRVLKDEDLYLRFTSLISKADTLLADIDQYGLLFNLNKRWQRRYAKRAEALAELKTPQGFRSYFEEEMEKINHAMNRVTLLVDHAQTSQLEHPEFNQAFSELLRRVDTLENNLKLFLQNKTQNEERRTQN